MITTRPEKRQTDVVVGVLFAAVTVLRAVSDDATVPWAVLYVLPVGLLALSHGVAGGLTGTLVASLLYAALLTLEGGQLSAAMIPRFLSWATVGIGFGLLEQLRLRSARQAEGWFELSSDLLAEVDAEGHFVQVNEQWFRLLGHPAGSLVGKSYQDFVHPDDLEASRRAEASLSGGEMTINDFENRFVAADGRWHWILWSSRVKDGLIYSSGKDITDRKLAERAREDQLNSEHNAARSDELTGLPNRRAWEEELENEVSRSESGERNVALAILDLDNFKVLNDTQGHAAGDDHLRRCAAEWSKALRSTDFMARIGGEEFGILMPHCPPELAVRVVDRIRHLTPPPETCSAGIALLDRNETFSETMARADKALYLAKEGGRNRSVFEPA
ncbi:MAG: hypothetical protein QG596_1106 [Actinomycetota bacterium]|nr:hypothetical protein [Actinomycetota bacterium]